MKKLLLGIDRIAHEPALREELSRKRVALVAHPASVNSELVHSIDVLKKFSEIKLTSAFGPQHGMKGDKQYNMVESEDEFDTELGIPIFSLYGKVRRPTAEMMKTFDVVLIDLQDLGCRIYTFITTLLYMMEECSKTGKSVWVLDRPNPVGRPAEGMKLIAGNESFVGAGPIPMRHGMTMGELALYFKSHFKLNLDLKIIEMKNYSIVEAPGFGWPLGQLSWVNPSPNAPTLSMARCYAGSVLLEGTLLTEGRGTTRPLEIAGAPDLDAKKIIKFMHEFAPKWLEGCRLRECYFEPTFYKHQNKLCQGIQVHVDDSSYQHELFKPFRVFSLFLKAVRTLSPDYKIWRDFGYEYVFDRLAIDVINGGPDLRLWVDDLKSKAAEFDLRNEPSEKEWLKERKPFLLY